MPQTEREEPNAHAESLLEMRDIHKSFPGVHALKGVDFDVRPGEVHALAGENGAGKSTLMHVLAGVYPPDSGTILFDGCHGITIENEHAAQNLGISIVYQERSLVGSLSVAENIFAGRHPVGRFGVIDYRELSSRAVRILDQLGLGMDPRTLVDRLSPAEQQMVEIAKALSVNARLLIFDEPTSALTETETEALFRVIGQLKSEGVGIVYISHRLEEIFRIADRVTVLKDGECRGTLAVSETTSDALISLMVGRKMLSNLKPREKTPESNRIVLEVRHLSDRDLVRDVSFSLRAGEILAFAGLAGAGRTELALAIFGAIPNVSGEVLVEDRPVRISSPEDAISVGLGYLPEERRESGLFLDMSVAMNIAAARLDYFGNWWQNDRKIAAVADEYRAKLKIATPSIRQDVRKLSGGNQQKIVLAKWLLLNPKVLIVDEPTRGIDVGAKAEVHKLLFDLARQGTGIMLISSELPEVLAVADRILIMRSGRITGELDARDATEEAILRYASNTPTEVQTCP